MPHNESVTACNAARMAVVNAIIRTAVLAAPGSKAREGAIRV